MHLCDAGALFKLGIKVLVPILRGVELEFPDHFDRDFLTGSQINRLVDIGECAVSHLLNEFIAFQTFV